MKRPVLICGGLLLILASYAQSMDSLGVNLQLKDASFEQLTEQIETQVPVTIVYKPQWFSSLRLNVSGNHLPLIKTLEQVLDSGFWVSNYKNHLIILPGEPLIVQLPDYEIKQQNAPNKVEEPITSNASPFMKGRKADLIKFTIGDSRYPVTGRKINVNATLKDARSGNPVEGATLYVEETRQGEASNNLGQLSLKMPAGKYTARIECLGMEKINAQLVVMSDGEFTVNMQKANYEIGEVVIYGDRQMSVRDKDPGLEKVNVKAVKELPMMMGESDIIKVSEMLPGIVSVGEGAAGLNVRGGSFDQNAFYFNQIPVYNTSHMFGFFPAFNADVISDFSIYKGYIPAQYGGKISSIFDINARTGNKKRFTAHGGISPIAGNLTIEGPIKRDTASFLVSGRTSYSDWILKQIDNYTLQNSKASFQDINVALNYDLPKTQISLFAYRSQDYFKLHIINTYRYSNTGLSAQAGHNFSNSFRGDISLSGVRYEFNTQDNQIELSAYEQHFDLDQYDLKAGFQKTFSDNKQLDFGADAVFYGLNRGTVAPLSATSLQNNIDLGNEQGLEAALYISAKMPIIPLLTIDAGFRFSAFSSFGPNKVYTYFDNAPREFRNIADSIEFRNFEPIKWYYFPEFRAALNYQTDEFGSLKLSFTQMHQNIFMLNNAITIAPNSPWKLADYHLKPARSIQLSLGAFRTFPRGGWDAGVEVFFKNTTDFTEFKDGADFLNNSLVETAVLQGMQKSYGIEFLLKRTGKRVDGWLAYTWSRSLIQVNGGEVWNSINHGKVYPSNYDIPHVVNAILNYHVSKRVTLSTTVTYQTGKPSTFPTGYYFIEGQPFLDYSNRNEYRIPDYFRTDLSLVIEGNLRKKKWLHSSFMFSVYNVTSRKNAYSVYFTKENGSIYSYKYSVIGVPVFSASWIFKLGNYEAD